MNYCDFCKNNLYPQDFIAKTNFWTVLLSWNQQHIGRCLVVLNRHCENISSLEESEWKDLFFLMKKLEKTLKKIFPVSLFNWSCLMNDAFLKKFKNSQPHVHWHMVPRYHKDIIFENEIFTDPVFGYNYYKDQNYREVSSKIRVLLIKKIKSFFQKKNE